MSKHVVITSIFEPTIAVGKFASLPGIKLIVVGDKKSPAHWNCPGAVFLPVDHPDSRTFALASVLPFNHYCRKMLGYLHAVRDGAECIIDTDDDNIPKEDWEFPAFEGSFPAIKADCGYVNIYRYYTDQQIWPRGLPLRFIRDSNPLPPITPRHLKVGVWQGLADADPDVDAIYRLTSDAPCHFDRNGCFVLGKGTLTPFNSQNTAFTRELFPLLYLPTYVTFRFTDILRGLVAQPIMWTRGWHLGFTDASVVQERNPHDYFKDFLSEIPMYQAGEQVVEIVAGAISNQESIPSNLSRAYEALRARNVVSDSELVTLEAWLRDLEKLG